MFRPSRLLFPTDFSYYSFFAAKYAVAVARRYGARLYIAHAVDSHIYLPWGSPSFWLWSESLHERESEMCQHAAHRLERLMEALAKEGIDADYRVVRGSPVDETCRLAHELECDLVVVGTHGRKGMEHALFGSVAEEVACKASSPVLTIKHPQHEFLDFPHGRFNLRRVMFPTDFSAFSLSALPYAVSLCREFEATLVLLHTLEQPVYPGEFVTEVAVVIPEDAERRAYEQLQALADEIKDVRVEPIQAIGVPHQQIIATAHEEDIDLLVLPTHGRTGVARMFLGGVARRVLRHTRCPILTVRPEMAAVKLGAAGATDASTWPPPMSPAGV